MLQVLNTSLQTGPPSALDTSNCCGALPQPRSSRISTAFSLSATRTTGCFDQPVNDTMANLKEGATAFRKHVCSAVLLIMPASIQALRKFASE